MHTYCPSTMLKEKADEVGTIFGSCGGVVSLNLLKSSQFKTDLKSYNDTRDRNTLEALCTVVRMLGNKQSIPAMYDDHPLQCRVRGLKGTVNVRDCHPQGDRVLLYEILDDAIILYRFGKHSEVLERVRRCLKDRYLVPPME